MNIRVPLAIIVALTLSMSCRAALKLAAGDQKPFLVIMVDTKQSKFDVDTETMAKWIFPATTNYYTMQDWLCVNFAGKVSIAPCQESCDTKNDGVIKVLLDSDDPQLGEPRTMEGMCRDALLKAAPTIDLSRYDKKKKGQIGPPELGILFLFAKTQLSGGGTSFNWAKIPLPELNGVKFDGFEFICAPPGRDNVGAIIHDWIHIYGEKDFYARDKTRFGVSDLHLGYIWKGLLKGRKGPSNLMPMSMENFGIVAPEVVTKSGEYTLRAHSTGRYNYLKIPTADPKEYFLVENRQFDDFDECLANKIKEPGIVIYHVDRNQEIKGNFNNDDMNHRMVTIEAANEKNVGFNEYNVVGGSDKTDHDVLWHEGMIFGPETVPSSKLYSGQSSGIALKIISPNARDMKVWIKLLGQTVKPATLKVMPAKK